MAKAPGRSSSLALLAVAFAIASNTVGGAVAHANVAEEVNPPDEGRFHRSGFSAGALLGLGALIGSGSQDEIRGFGAGVSLRVGTRATRDVQWILQLDSSSYVTLNKQGEKRRDDITNNVSLLTLGAQYFVRPRLWVRGGLGVARSQISAVEEGEKDIVKGGLGLVGGGGLDIYQKRFFAINIELLMGAGVYQKGAIFSTGVGVAVNLY